MTESSGLYVSMLSVNTQGDFEFADGSVPPAGASLEIPSPGTNVSGIGLVSGWSCLGGELEVEFSDAEGVILTQTVLQGTERIDTEGVCGDIDNGFSSPFNWGRLGPGERTARLIRNGEEVASSTFMVAAFDRDFLPDAEGMCTIVDFPEHRPERHLRVGNESTRLGLRVGQLGCFTIRCSHASTLLVGKDTGPLPAAWAGMGVAPPLGGRPSWPLAGWKPALLEEKRDATAA